MTITFVTDAPTQWISSPSGEDYPRQVVVDLGRPGMHYGIEMRDLIHWAAARLDTGPQGRITNHRAAVLLRGVAELLYPYMEDEVDYVADELEDAGVDVDAEFSEAPIPLVDVRLLCLEDGLVRVGDTFAEVLWDGQPADPVLKQNAKATIDFLFPEGTEERFGVRGLRIFELDLICWLTEGVLSSALSLEADQDVWLDELVAARGRAKSAWDSYQARRLKWFEQRQGEAEAPGSMAPSEIEQDQILRELAALI